MERAELAEKYFDAWNRRNVSDLLSLLHPQASYFDAFWGEACSGAALKKFIETELETAGRWYRLHPEIIPTRSGMIARYTAFDGGDTAGVNPLFSGAEIITVAAGLIRTISDHYCDISVADLLEVAEGSESRHARSDAMIGGLSSREASRIRRRLRELAVTTGIYLDPSLTVTKLADHVGCSVMHLFHVIENELETTFLAYVNECRSRYASRLLLDEPDRDKRFDEIAMDCGFESVQAFREAFTATFGLAPDDYMAQFER